MSIEKPFPCQRENKVGRRDRRIPEVPKGLRDLKGLQEKTFRAWLREQPVLQFLHAYAKSINKAYGRTGSLFQHPFGRVPITSDRQFWNVIAYIHQNPQKHKFVQDFRDWKYSSYGIILAEKKTLIKRDEVMNWFGTKEDYLSLHNQWVTDAQAKWFAEDDFD